VPFNSFAEYAPEPNPETKKMDVVWFALNEDRPLFAFAGIWTTFNGDRGPEIEAGAGAASGLWFSDDIAEGVSRDDSFFGPVNEGTWPHGELGLAISAILKRSTLVGPFSRRFFSSRKLVLQRTFLISTFAIKHPSVGRRDLQT
jgi:hypothetical protein